MLTRIKAAPYRSVGAPFSKLLINKRFKLGELKLLRAFARPYFLRSTNTAVACQGKPAAFSAPRSEGHKSCSGFEKNTIAFTAPA